MSKKLGGIRIKKYTYSEIIDNLNYINRLVEVASPVGSYSFSNELGDTVYNLDFEGIKSKVDSASSKNPKVIFTSIENLNADELKKIFG